MEPRQMERAPMVETLAETPKGIRQQVQEAVKIGVGRRLKVRSKPDTAVRQGYQVRESNWSIGRTVEMEGLGVRDYKPNDRWLAWRKRTEGKKQRAATRVTTRGGGGKKPTPGRDTKRKGPPAKSGGKGRL